MHILVVDDTAIARTMLDRSLKKWGYEVDCVSSSCDALDLLSKKPIQVVITDWVMPGGDGPSLCRDIRNLNLHYYTYIILVTSLESNESAIEGLNAGADDFVRKPIQLDELRARIRAGERVLDLEKSLKEKNEALTELSNNLIAARDLINRDLETAAKMQQDLLPVSSINYLDVSISWLFRPSFNVSGDIFNFLRLDETHVGFYILDVAGHGVTSAMMSFSLFKLFTSEMQRGSPLKEPLTEKPYYRLVSPASVMADLNTRFQINSNNCLYFTMIYGIVDTTNKTIELCQAGHPNPIYIASSQEVRFIGDGGFPIGITEIAEFETIMINYGLGDRLVLYSDGIVECVGTNKEMFGNHRLIEFFEQHRTTPLKSVPNLLNEKIRAWHGESPYEDDISMLILEMC